MWVFLVILILTKVKQNNEKLVGKEAVKLPHFQRSLQFYDSSAVIKTKPDWFQ